MGNTQQLYGRLDMVMLDRQDKIYGSLGMHDSYLLNTVTGNPLTLTHSREGKMDGEVTDCKIYGRSKQETTIGAQLFNASKFDEIEQYGVKLSVKDGVIYAEGTPTQDAWITAKLTADEIKKVFKNGKLTIKSEKVNNCNFTVGLYFKFIPTSFAADGSSIELTLPEKITDSCIYYYVNLIKGTEMIGGRKIMLYQDGNGTWESYTGGQPSPSPEYPQEIMNAGASGKVEEYVYGKNLFDERLVDFSNTTKNIDVPVRLRPGEKYALSADGTRKGAAISLRGFLNEGDGEGDEIITLRCTEGNVGTRIGSGKAVGDYHHYSVRVYYLSQGLKKIQLELGEYNTAYEPYRELQSFPIKSPTGFLGIPVDFGGNYTDANGQQWIADYVDLKRGKYVQNVRTITIDEKTRLWYQKELTTPTVEEGYYTVTCRADGIIGKELLVDKFRCSKAHWTNEIRYCQKEVYAFARSNDNAIVFVLPEERFANKTEFSEYLAEHPLTVMTYLDTPIERNLTQEEIQAYKNLVTYAGTTMVGNDAGCHMECTYKASGNE